MEAKRERILGKASLQACPIKKLGHVSSNIAFNQATKPFFFFMTNNWSNNPDHITV